jgi:hypothetical protein
MVRAILDGRKTMTRRVVKPQPFEDPKWGLSWAPRGIAENKPIYCERNANFNPITKAMTEVGAPLGTIGDRLWVRETWGLMSYHDTTYWCGYSIKDVSEAELRERFLVEHATNWDLPNESAYWRPSIHMPRWASRITLEITAVRVERLQEMEGMDAASSDALKEGVNRIHHEGGNYYYSAFRNQPDPKNWTDPYLAFKELWQSRHGNWDADPWVWAYSIKLIKL